MVLRRKTKKRTAACADQRQEATNVCDFRRFLYLSYTVKIRVVQRGVVEVKYTANIYRMVICSNIGNPLST